MTVYVDVLFLVNFSMDLLALYGAGAVLGRKKQSPRLLAAALLGGAYGVAEVLLLIEPPWGTVLLLSVSLFMVGIAYGRHGFFSLYIVFVGAEAFLGGIMTLAYTVASRYLGEWGTAERGGAVSTPGFLFALTVSIVIGLAVHKTLDRAGHGVSEVRATVGGRSFSFSAVCDSGNLLKDPLTDTPVILLGERVPGAAWLSSYKNPKGFRVIPYETVGGSGILLGHRPEFLEITCRGRRYRPEALLAVATGTEAFDGKGGCVPTAVLRG